MFATIGPKKRPMSVMEARDPEVLSLMLDFYAWPEAQVLDVTANERRMWKGIEHPGGVTYADIDPAMNPDILADFRSLPCEAESYDVIVFDPPHLPAAAASQESDEGYVDSYGLSHAPKANNIAVYFRPFLQEASRVLRKDGLIFAKLKDFVHNHVYQWMLAEFVHEVRRIPGLTPCDLIVKRDPGGGNLQSSKWINVHHVRNAHCWWIIVRKGRCEGRKRSPKLSPHDGGAA